MFTYFRAELDFIKENRRNRSRLGEAIKTQGRVVDQLLRGCDDPAKLSTLEEKISKVVYDLAKSKEQKRKEEDKKAKKEEYRATKLREKEENAISREERKKEQANISKKKTDGSKDDAAVIKSRSIMQSFLQRKSDCLSVEELQTHVEHTSTCHGFNTLRFDNELKSQQPSGIGHGPPSFGLMMTKLRSSRKPKKFTVAIESGAINKGSGLVEVQVDSRMRMLSFAENVRPPYFGTFSKNSTVISGRRPLAKDHRIFDYDYDSECDWEEESEGEDIAESVNEEEEGGNELEFDEFCLHDNDFGSDVDSDEEGLMMQVNRNLSTVVEVLGPRFFVSRDIAYFMQMDSLTRCQITEKDFIRLQAYFPVIHHTLPTLGGSEDRNERLNVASIERDNRFFSAEATVALANLLHGKKESVEKIVQNFLAQYPDFKKVFTLNLNLV